MFTRKKILVVEDNEINRTMLSTLLLSEYDVLEAENGQVALSVLKAHKDEIALILLDITMPVMDGYTFLSIMKADQAYAAIPVIVTTQSDSEDDEVAALSHGATDFVAKPYKPQIILHRVASIIHLRETAAMINQFQYDRLTGLYSREYFYQRAKDSLRQNPGQKYDIICSNIENFKLINDVFGIVAGDQLLRGIAGLYQKYVGDNGIYGRLNADQFACMVKSGTHYTNKIFIRMNELVNAMPNGKNVGMKWGVYAVDDADLSIERMCDRALLAARSIKGQYGKYFAAYDDKLRGKLLHQQAILDSMESALAEKQFFLHLQPKYQLQDGTLAGAEALVRWKHPEWGVQSPAEFIPIFEQNGFITKLDQFVWDEACSLLRKWNDAGLPPLPVSVNVSRADIYNMDIADILMNIIRKYGLSPERLHLEITESAYTEHPSQIIETVHRLRRLGFIIEMDDFGSGYSSLNMLNQMPIDILKLDMKFIQTETAKSLDHGILRFIMDLARWMHLSVVAEGVETREQVVRLAEIGCDYVQGYYFSKPMSCEAFEELLKTRQITEKEEWKRRGSGEQHQILIADEDAAYRALVRPVLTAQFPVLETDNLEGMRRMVASQGSRLAAIIVSATLPGFREFDKKAAYQDIKDMWNIPVLVTGKPDEQYEEQALRLGAADYADKPHTPESLYRRVLHAIKLAAFQEQEQVLHQEAYRDHMTRILNRRGLETAIAFLRKEDAPLAYFLFDLDNLKHINDTHGHIIGDRFIKEFSDILQAYTRETDILSRFGGDEFIVIMKRMRSGDDALKKGEEICQALRNVTFAEGVTSTVSVGITISNGEEPLDEVIQRVDTALYQAKASRKGHAICEGRQDDGE